MPCGNPYNPNLSNYMMTCVMILHSLNWSIRVCHVIISFPNKNPNPNLSPLLPSPCRQLPPSTTATIIFTDLNHVAGHHHPPCTFIAIHVPCWTRRTSQKEGQNASSRNHRPYTSYCNIFVNHVAGNHKCNNTLQPPQICVNMHLFNTHGSRWQQIVKPSRKSRKRVEGKQARDFGVLEFLRRPNFVSFLPLSPFFYYFYFILHSMEG